MAAKKKNPLEEFAQNELAKLLVDRNAGLKELDLFDFLVRTSPHYQAPSHLAPLLPYFKRAEETPSIFCFSAPPRHGKSVLTNHWVARLMLRKPGIRIAYGCYSLDLSAGFFSGEVKDILTSNGVKVRRDKNTKEEWELENGSSFKSIAPGSGFTGRGADVVIIDDPYKSRQEAESPKVREVTWNWIKDVCVTRRSPTASIVVTHTRWHIDDTIGMLSREHKFPYVNLPAVSPEGQALWPTQWPLDRLENEIRKLVGEYTWNSLYLGNPIPMGGAVFKGTNLYSEAVVGTGASAPEGVQLLPTQFKRVTIGIDCAYTKKSHADYSVAVVLGTDDYDNHYILDVRRVQTTEVKEFAATLRELRQMWNSPPIYWYVGGQEKVIAELFRNVHGIPVKDIPAKEDKFARAQAVAGAWNSGKVFMPAVRKQWTDAFTSEILQFSGLGDIHDDQVDALAAAFVPSTGKKVYRGMRGPGDSGGFNPFGF